MASYVPALQTAKCPEIEYRGAIAAVNSCLVCQGNQVCQSCNGYGKNHDGRGHIWTCPGCAGEGRCLDCADHCLALRRFVSDLKRGSYPIAEGGLQREILKAEQEREGASSSTGTLGAGFGAVVGTILAPGLGTIVGLSMGKMLGDKAAHGTDLTSSHWRHADLLYCLGVLYAAQGRKAEAEQAWMKSLTLNDKHQAARNALR